MSTHDEAIPLVENRFCLSDLEMGLGLWQGIYQQTTGLWLRWYNATDWVPTLAEKAEQERQRAEQLPEYLRRRVCGALSQASGLSLDIARDCP